VPDVLALWLVAAGVGMAITAPPGPVTAICIARTLREGLAAGLWSGFGVATGDAVLAWIAALALAAAGPEWSGHRWLALGAVPVLVWLAVVFWRRARRGAPVAAIDGGPAEGGAAAAPVNGRLRALGHFGGPLLLAFTTPGTIPGFLALYSGLGLAARIPPGWTGPAALSGGVLTGAMCWWLGVCGLTARLRQRVVPWLHWVDYVSASLMALAAGYAVWVGLA